MKTQHDNDVVVHKAEAKKKKNTLGSIACMF